MKRLFTSALLTLVITTWFSVLSSNKAIAQSYGVSFDMFYHELLPYGNWSHDANYGDVWYPNVEQDFRPYGTRGYWTMTEYGNTWVSDYSWGWAAFHYGRWVHNPYRGWGWIPGYDWGPAWVDWRSGNGYYGWAPMGPRVNVSISLPMNMWIFIPNRHIYSNNIHRHWSFGRSNIYNRTTIINNTYVVNNHNYYGGPSVRHIERNTGRRVVVNQVRYSDNPGASRVDNRTVSVYRPDQNSRGSVTNRATADRRTTTRGTEANNVRGTQNVNSSRGTAQRELYIDRNGNASVNDGTRSTSNRAEYTTPSRSTNPNVNTTTTNRGRVETSQRVESPTRETTTRTNERISQPVQREVGNINRSTTTVNRDVRSTEHSSRTSRPTSSSTATNSSSSRGSSTVSSSRGTSSVDRNTNTTSSSNRGNSTVGSSRGASSVDRNTNTRSSNDRNSSTRNNSSRGSR